MIFKDTTLLDEMQEQKAAKSKCRAFWLAWIGLLIALIVEFATHATIREMAPEGIIFVVISVYGTACDIRNGLWDRYLRPNITTNLLLSCATGLFMGVFFYFSYRDSGIAFCIASGLFVAALCFGALQLCCAIYKKRRKTLDTSEEEDPSTDEE